MIDLVRADNDILPAFYRALAETLVADDLNAATRIAYQGDRAVHRVVTLDGTMQYTLPACLSIVSVAKCIPQAISSRRPAP